MTKEGFTNILNFMTLRVGVAVLGCGHIRDIHVVKIPNHKKNSTVILGMLQIIIKDFFTSDSRDLGERTIC